jgi:hypothetical protein
MIPYISRMVLVVIASFTTAVLLTVTAIWAMRLRQQFKCSRNGNFLGTLAGNILCVVNHY